MSKNPIELELNEMRSLIAQSASDISPNNLRRLEAKLRELEEQVAGAGSSDPGEAARSAIMKALAAANNGKPGYLSHAQIEAECKLTKSASHHHVNELEKAGKVWIRKTHDPVSGRPCFFVYHPAAVRV